MAEKLTKAKVFELMRTVTRQTDIADGGERGLFARVTPSGRGGYYLIARYDGRQFRKRLCSLDAPIETARKRCREEKAMLDAGLDPRKKKDTPPPTLGRFIEDTYASWAEQNMRTGGAIVRDIKQSFSAILGKRMDRISVLDFERWKKDLIDRGRKPASVNRRLTYVQSLYGLAGKMGVIPKDCNPARDCGRLQETRGRVRYLSPDERQRFMAALYKRLNGAQAARRSHNEWLAKRGMEERGELLIDSLTTAIIVSLETGLRRSELLGARWNQVDIERRIFEVLAERNKTGMGRVVGLSDQAHDALSKWRTQVGGAEGYIFPDAKKGGHVADMRKGLRAVCDAAEPAIENFSWHAMRHDFASRLAMGGVDLFTLARLLGHSDTRTTEVYAHLSPAHMQKAIDVLNRQDNVVELDSLREVE